MVTKAVPLAYFCKKYPKVGYFVGCRSLAWVPAAVMKPSRWRRDAVRGAGLVSVLQLSGFITAAGVGMLAVRDARCRAPFCLGGRRPGE